jgi:phosphoribosylaminoimidazole-succinocarboxamide synthase
MSPLLTNPACAAEDPMGTALFQTNFPGLNLKGRGKVRDIYDLGATLLIVASDRISAFDVVMSDPIPDKGKILTQISAFWFGQIADLAPHHLLSTDVAAFPPACRRFSAETLSPFPRPTSRSLSGFVSSGEGISRTSLLFPLNSLEKTRWIMR